MSIRRVKKQEKLRHVPAPGVCEVDRDLVGTEVKDVSREAWDIAKAQEIQQLVKSIESEVPAFSKTLFSHHLVETYGHFARTLETTAKYVKISVLLILTY